jgi:hypothetical protein
MVHGKFNRGGEGTSLLSFYYLDIMGHRVGLKQERKFITVDQEIWEEHKVLHHYTDLGGLKGIIESQSFWATNYQYLNDNSELKIAAPVLFDILFPKVMEECKNLLPDDLRAESIIKNRLERYINTAYRVVGHNFFITSFCGEHHTPYSERHGLLSQWRGYGKNQGFRLTFDTKELCDWLCLEEAGYASFDMFLGSVKYHDTVLDLKKEFADNFKIIEEEVVSFIYKDLSGEELEVEGENQVLYNSFISTITRIKHCGFFEENEVRLVAHCPVGTEYDNLKKSTTGEIPPEKRVHLRQNTLGGSVPYIIVPERVSSILPIKKILVGPGEKNAKEVRSLSMWLAHYDDERRELISKIDCSEIPFS